MPMTPPDTDAASQAVVWSFGGRCALAVLLAMLIGSSGCVSLAYYWRTIRVETQTHTTTNQGMPVAVEIVFVHDDALVDTIGSMTATKWFDQRQALKWRHSEGVRWHRWEWAPGQHVPTQRLPVRYGADAAFVFASYQSSGAHRSRIPPYRSLQLILNRDAFRVRPAD